MTFSETYRAERLIDRRSRGRKARIAGRIIGFGLMACLIVAIRTDPQLRAMVDNAALSLISGAVSDQQEISPNQTPEHLAALEELGIDPQSAGTELLKPEEGAYAGNPGVGHLPASKVKIHRGGIARD